MSMYHGDWFVPNYVDRFSIGCFNYEILSYSRSVDYVGHWFGYRRYSDDGVFSGVDSFICIRTRNDLINPCNEIPIDKHYDLDKSYLLVGCDIYIDDGRVCMRGELPCEMHAAVCKMIGDL